MTNPVGPPLPGTVKPVPAGTKGFDEAGYVLSQQQCIALKAEGFQFAVRYFPNENSDSGKYISSAEANLIVNSGLGLMLVQRSHKATFKPTITDGQNDANLAITYAQMVGYPQGATLWCDMENLDTTNPVQMLQNQVYASEWANAVKSAGFNAGCYLGSGPGVTSDEAGSLPFDVFWIAPNVKNLYPTGKGFALIQDSIDQTGYVGKANPIDVDHAQVDDQGKSAMYVRK